MRTGFFQEAPNVYSMARLCAFICIASGNAAIIANAYVLILFAQRGHAIPEGFTAFGGMAVGLVIAAFGGAWVALRERHKTSDELPQPVILGDGAQVIQNQPTVSPQ
jgi:hypothetical protein